MKSRVAASIALAAALLIGTTGCTFGANIATQEDYDPSDGVGTEVGALAIRNALLIGETGDELNIVMTVASSADSDLAGGMLWSFEPLTDAQPPFRHREIRWPPEQHDDVARTGPVERTARSVDLARAHRQRRLGQPVAQQR